MDKVTEYMGDRDTIGYVRYLVAKLGSFALEYICEDLPVKLQVNAHNVASTIIMTGKCPWGDDEKLETACANPPKVNDDYPGMELPEAYGKSQLDIIDMMEKGDFK